ncbi:UNVERIFIED_CONTAM: hypothetical protein GTU68_024388 [Idotea baltica]|nr:hypothetical protein [Idotea baltica]
MPEGHTIHRIARDHTRDFVGQKIKTYSPQGRFRDEAKKINGRCLESIDAWGKHLLYRMQGKHRLHIHLGLYGKFRSQTLPVAEPVGAVRLRAIGDNKAFDLNGPNTCELIDDARWAQITRRLGADPLRKDANVDAAWSRISRSRAAIATLLLNQSVIAGVGNVYRAEALHLLKIHPERPGKDLSRDDFDAMWKLLVKLLKTGVKYNRIIISDPNDIGKSRSRMNRQEALLVYKHEFCRRCDSPIESWSVGSRTIYACTTCQQ